MVYKDSMAHVVFLTVSSSTAMIGSALVPDFWTGVAVFVVLYLVKWRLDPVCLPFSHANSMRS